MAQITTLAAGQEGGTINSLGETTKQRVLRSTLRKDHMGPIAWGSGATAATLAACDR